jgi:carboxyl-terminal processing protease
LEECVSLTGLFIKTGPVVQVVNALGQQRILEDDDSSVLYDGPLVVLTSRFSASASEILA